MKVIGEIFEGNTRAIAEGRPNSNTLEGRNDKGDIWVWPIGFR